MPISTAFTVGSEIPKLEPRVDYSSKRITFRGSELMQEVAIPPAIGGATSTVPRGGVFACIPLNPGLNDGLRVNRGMSMWDQFRIKSLTVEYVPTCPTTTAGGLAMAVVNDPADLLSLEGGFSAMRDLMTREGAVAFSPFARAVANQGMPLLKWYFTSTESGPDLTVPGNVYVMAATDFSNATASSIPLGLIWLHYEFEVRAPSIEKQDVQAFYVSSASLAVNTAITADATCSIPSASLPPVFQNAQCVGWGTIVACDDVAAGSATWRTLTEVSTGNTVTLQPGTILYWRSWKAAGALQTYLYPSLSDALSAEYASLGYQWTVTQGAVVRGFKLWNIQGAPLNGDY